MGLNNFVKANIESLDKICNSLGGFVAGTLVHTDKGLVPIEQIKVGDMVRSKPNGLGESCYKSVTQTFELEDKEVWFIEVTNFAFHDAIKRLPNNLPYLNECFIATPNHRFWVVGRLDQAFDGDVGFQSIVFLKNGYWSRLDKLDIDTVLLLANGSYAAISSIQSIFEMKNENNGFVKGYLSPTWDEQGYGNYVEFTDSGFVAHLDRASRSFNDKGKYASVKRRKVFNFVVEGFRAYFVGKSGVWVHDSNCCDEQNL